MAARTARKYVWRIARWAWLYGVRVEPGSDEAEYATMYAMRFVRLHLPGTREGNYVEAQRRAIRAAGGFELLGIADELLMLAARDRWGGRLVDHLGLPAGPREIAEACRVSVDRIGPALRALSRPGIGFAERVEAYIDGDRDHPREAGEAPDMPEERAQSPPGDDGAVRSRTIVGTTPQGQEQEQEQDTSLAAGKKKSARKEKAGLARGQGREREPGRAAQHKAAQVEGKRRRRGRRSGPGSEQRGQPRDDGGGEGARPTPVATPSAADDPEGRGVPVGGQVRGPARGDRGERHQASGGADDQGGTSEPRDDGGGEGAGLAPRPPSAEGPPGKLLADQTGQGFAMAIYMHLRLPGGPVRFRRRNAACFARRWRVALRVAGFIGRRSGDANPLPAWLVEFAGRRMRHARQLGVSVYAMEDRCRIWTARFGRGLRAALRRERERRGNQ